ncbi:MAG: hypothetical protein ACXW1M_04800, partial [Acidimicrobiia bacterium]
ACESLQRAAASRGHRAGPMSTVWEGGVYMQVRMVADGYLRGDVPLRPEQPSSTVYPRRELQHGA